MDYNTLVFLAILTTATTQTALHHQCNSDVSSLASGMADLQQLTTLQYCLTDNCTIVRTDTGEQLDIITSVIISQNEPEIFCPTGSPNTSEDSTINQLIGLVIVTFIALVSGYIAVIHMLFKQLRGTFGKLMMLHNIALVCQSFNILALNITHRNIVVHSTMPCYLFHFLFMQSAVMGEAFATSFLAYLAHIMCQSYRSVQVTKQTNRKLYKYSIVYALVTVLLLSIFSLSYDFGTGTFKHTLLPNGHCSILVQTEYNTIQLFHFYIYINEIIQTLLLVAYFVYYYKYKKMFTIIQNMATSDDIQQNRLFFKIAVTMGATLGLSQVIFASSWYFDNEIGLRISGSFFLIQQCIIMSLYICSKKVSQLCKEKLCITKAS